MNRTIHEIIVTDNRVRLRSSIDSPIDKHGHGFLREKISQESGLPSDLEEYLLQLITLHDEKLVRVVGEVWLEMPPLKGVSNDES